MHKAMLKFFDFLKNCAQFFKILSVFLILMLLLYWTQNLAGYKWDWMLFITPLLNALLDVAENISDGSISLFAAVFEFKYFFVLVFFLFLYYISEVLEKCIEFTEEMYGKGRQYLRKKEEDFYNKSIHDQMTFEQSQIKKYQIYVEAFVKQKFAHKEYNINMEEQNQLMNKFLINQTGVNPIKYENGYLYTFESFKDIDAVLDIFSRLSTSKAPIDYLICVQILDKNSGKEREQLNALIDLKILNKIATLSDTVYRYMFNRSQRYETIQLGIFQKEDWTFEVHEFQKR